MSAARRLTENLLIGLCGAACVTAAALFVDQPVVWTAIARLIPTLAGQDAPAYSRTLMVLAIAAVLFIPTLRVAGSLFKRVWPKT